MKLASWFCQTDSVWCLTDPVWCVLIKAESWSFHSARYTIGAPETIRQPSPTVKIRIWISCQGRFCPHDRNGWAWDPTTEVSLMDLKQMRLGWYLYLFQWNWLSYVLVMHLSGRRFLLFYSILVKIGCSLPKGLEFFLEQSYHVS